MAESVIQLTGFKELAAALRELPEKVAKQAVYSAVLAGGKVIRNEARLKAPVKTGAVKSAIVLKREKPEEPGAKYVVAVSTRQIKKYVEKSRSALVKLQGPSQPVTINGKTYRKAQLYGKKESYIDYGDLYYWIFSEFGTSKQPAHPYMRPAFESKKEEAVKAIGEKLDERIQRYARELAKK